MKNLRRAGCRLAFLAGFAIAPHAGLAQTPVYFPLQTGNSWLYKASGSGGTAFETISVEDREVIGDREYFRIRYFNEQVLLPRAAPSGSIFAYDPASKSEYAWLSPALPPGSTFPAPIDQCTTTGRIAERGAAVSTPAGQFGDTVRIAFEGHCADGGTVQQVYARGAGLIVHEESSFAGPRRYELVYYRAGASNATAPEVSFTVALDSATYKPGGELLVRLTLRNATRNSLTLAFPSGQSYDLQILDRAGKIVYTWSADKAFILLYRQEKFGPGERNWGASAPLSALPAGQYKVRAYLTTEPRKYLGEVSFEVAE